MDWRLKSILINNIETISPIFLIIALGYTLRRSNYLSEETLDQLNRFTFNFSLPVLVFLNVSRTKEGFFTIPTFFSILLPTILILVLSSFVGFFLGLRRGRLGTFIQTSLHGNVSYVGLAVLFYMVGEEALRRGSLFVGLLIILNNTISIFVLQITSRKERNLLKPIVQVLSTPVIIATFLGASFSFTHITLPQVLSRSFQILANVALPLALIVIGGNIKADTFGLALYPSFISSLLKVFFLPLTSLPILFFFEIPKMDLLTLTILFACPSAISSYVMAKELGGDPKLASGGITLSTLISPVGFIFWNSLLA